MKDGKTKSIIITVLAVIALIVVIFLIVRSEKRDTTAPDSEPVAETAAEQEETGEALPKEDDFGIGSHPDINTNTAANPKHVTPGGVDYSFIDTTGMTEEEIAALEARIDEEAGYTYESNTNIADQSNTRGMYLNSVWSCTFPSGGVLKIGVDTNSTDAIYLNPVYEATEDEYMFSEDETHFAFYFKAASGMGVETAVTAGSTYNEGLNASCKYHVITDRTYDTLVPAEFQDPTTYGVRWYDSNNFHGFDGSDNDIEIRIVRQPSGTLMGTAKLHIDFNEASSTYSITSLVNSDVLYTGELTEEQRADLVERAFAFFCSDDKGQTTNIDTAYWDTYRARAIVEKVDSCYFPVLFGKTGDVMAAGQYHGKDLYAVNIVYPNYGFATIYAAPQRQINGLREGVPADEDIQPFAYDAFKPFTADTLFVPQYLEQEFYR